MKTVKPVEQSVKDSIVKTTLEYSPNMDTMGGLLGRWTVEGKDANGKTVFGCMADYGYCLKYAERYGVEKSQIVLSDAAKKKLGVR